MKPKSNLIASLVCTAGLALSGQAVAAAKATIFIGKILTMDDKNPVAAAVGVDARGLIVAVGSTAEVSAGMQHLNPVTKNLRENETMLPGFIDPHMHIASMALTYSGLFARLAPCLPEPYSAAQAPDCQANIEGALEELKTFIGDRTTPLAPAIGMELDPSRQPYSDTLTASAFKAEPAEFINRFARDTPVLIIDQSGHFGYVNTAAFRYLQEEYERKKKDGIKSKDPDQDWSWPPKIPNGGEWMPKIPGTEPDGSPESYSGLLLEMDGYAPFLEAFLPVTASKLTELEGVVHGSNQALAKLRAAGVTTVMSMLSSYDEYSVARFMAAQCGNGTRIGAVVPPELAAPDKKWGAGPEKPSCIPSKENSCMYPRFIGVSGIKTIVDGSTQGCTAALQGEQKYTVNGGCFTSGNSNNVENSVDNGNGNGRIDYAPGKLYDSLEDLWNQGTGWRFESHAVGNRAMEMALDTYSKLRSESSQDNRVVIIHSTVGDKSMWQRAGKLIAGQEITKDGKNVPLKLHFTHLIAHVPYWGGAFQRMLGNATAENIVPFGWDKEFKIPYSMHSDVMVSDSRPLWFVRQAVTRQSWTYPNLEAKNFSILGAQHKLSVQEALRAVTINPAIEKGLDKQIGSIEVGKVADFVVLDQNPLQYASENQDELSRIKVVATYLSGQETGEGINPQNPLCK